MKKFNKVSVAVLVVAFVLTLARPNATLAATAAVPPLGDAASFSVLGAATMSSANITTISGNLGISPGLEISKTGTWTHTGGSDYFGTGGLSASAQTAALGAYNNLVAQTTSGGWGTSPWSPAPGVWTDASSPVFTGTITLNGGYSDVWVFQISTDFTFSGNVVLAGNAQACNVFWQVARDATIASGSNFVGTLIASRDITSASGATINGRLISLTGTTLAMNGSNSSITGPTCATPPPAPATLHVIKTVINDNGGTAVASDFTLKVTGTNVSLGSFAGSVAGVDVTLDAGSYAVTEPVVPIGYLQTGAGDCSGTITAGNTKTCTITNDDITPQLIVNKVVVNDNGGAKVFSDFPLFIDGGSVTSGVASTTTIGLHTVSETTDSGYTATIGGNCAADGTITLALGDVKTCTITNDDIARVVPPPSGGIGLYYAPVPPLIDVVKVPSPLALPDGPGTVQYTYTLRNIGTVPVNNVTMVGDTCSPITLISGDTNADARLDVNETWIYTCSATLTKTHTNIVTATGWANGISATDIANATVIVGVPVVPPLIHVTKIPSPLTLSAEGGMVTYTNKVTNPGTIALSNVSLTDDTCDPVKYISGDVNNDSKLDTTETWTYTCSAKLTKTTVNTVTASGEANGLIASDFAIATVIVNAAVPKLPIPKLPNTGLPPSENNIPWNIIVPTGIFALLALFYFARKKLTA